MKIVKTILLGLLAIVVIGIAALAITISYTASCPETETAAEGVTTMTAARARCYGSPDIITVEQVERPEPAADQLLVRVVAAGVNPLDYHYLRGKPYLMRLMTGIGSPEQVYMGRDYAGIVEAVGADVSEFAIGDAVFGSGPGAFAEYIVVRQDSAVAKMPENVSFAEAAGVGIAGVTALQALNEHGELKAGETVLINGASGGVGTFAVQIAKSIGAEVTGVCSTSNVELVRGLGADHVIDYKQQDYIDGDRQYDLIVDMVGNFSPGRNVKLLKPGGRYVIVGGPKGSWIAPLKRPLQAMWTANFTDRKIARMLAQMKREDIEALAALMRSAAVTPSVDAHYALSDIAEAMRHSETQRARGKIVIDVTPSYSEEN